jgi:hypothetical protein
METMSLVSAEVERLTRSVDWWNTAIVVMMVVAALAATGLVVTQYLALTRAKQLTKAIDQLSALKESEANQRISDAGERAAEANERAGNANERAVKLELEALSLRKQLMIQGPRENLLYGDNRKELLDALAPFAGQKAEVRYGLNPNFLPHTSAEPISPDAKGLASSLNSILGDAHWSVPQAVFPSHYQGDGTLVLVSLRASPKTVDAANALVKALNSRSLSAQGPGKVPNNSRETSARLFLPEVPGGPLREVPIPSVTDETIVVIVLSHPK